MPFAVREGSTAGELEAHSALLDCLLEAALLIDPGGRIAHANGAAVDLFEVPREELASKSLALTADELTLRAAIAFGRQSGSAPGAFEEGFPPAERAFVAPSGKARRLRVAAVPLRGPGGAAIGALALLVDAEGAAEDARRSDLLLRALADATRDAVFVLDRAGHALLANPAAREVASAPRGREGGEERAPSAADLRVMDSGVSETFEEVVATASGPRTYLSTRSPFCDERGATLGVVGISRDITDRKRIEEELRQGEELLRSIVETLSDGVWVVDLEGRVTFANSRLGELFGWRSAQMIGRTFIDFLPEEAAPAATRMWLDLAKGVEVRGELAYRRPDGARLRLWSRASPVRGPDGRVTAWVATFTDVTGLRETEERYVQAQKMESIGQLAGGVAHDFNNLLTVITSCTEELAAALDAGGRANREDVEEIRLAARRAADLTRQLLAFARKQVIDPVVLDLNEVVRGAQKLLGRVLGEDIELRTALQSGLWSVRCDLGQMEQVIMNLAVNSRDAMPLGGLLSIESANVEVDEPFATAHPEARPGPHVRLTIRDSGHGMTPEVKAHLFEPFFTTKPRGKGTGLGLATVYGIVQQSGGYILANSAPDLGAAFAIYLPRANEVPAPAPVPARADAEGGAETILVLEDDPQVREVTRRTLAAGGYRVLAASDGRAALELADREPGGVNLLLTDVILPGLDGPAVAKLLRERQSSLRVLFVSGYADDALGRRELDAGELLPKPFTPSVLLKRVRSILDQR
jgi:two-component system cell cycle sensor histidine kinase/response regulator CckA